MLAWIARFVASCRGSAYRRGLAALQQAGALAGPAFDRLAERGVEFELHNAPLLYPAFEQAELEHLRGVADELIGVGAAPLLEEISAAELRAVEPALSERVLGGLIARVDRRVRPESFCDGLRRAVVAGGAEVLEHSGVAALGRDGTGWIVAGRGHSPLRRCNRARRRRGVGRFAVAARCAAPDCRGQGLQPDVPVR